jgi:UDP-galactopyranose mutase
MSIPPSPRTADVLCFSHLRWNFVFQRPQHLMTRCARDRRVFFFEEPIVTDAVEQPSLRVEPSDQVTVATPHLPPGMEPAASVRALRALLAQLMRDHRIDDYVSWFYTPLALPFARDLSPVSIVYDCMDELSAFKGAPASLRAYEAELMQRASLVLTGGRALYEAKQHLHANIHAFPSSVDVGHFAQAREITTDAPDQAEIPRPRLGFCGVIDERMDLELIDAVAAARPEWHIVMLGPVVKIDPATLPRRPNIHYLGPRTYKELPHYLAGWDVALLPFARNEATRFISPTKTPEYLAAGRPVVSTSIQDVVRPYGEQGLVRIADDAGTFVGACAAALAEDAENRRARADALVRTMSWDATWNRIRLLMDACGRRVPEINTSSAAAV